MKGPKGVHARPGPIVGSAGPLIEREGRHGARTQSREALKIPASHILIIICAEAQQEGFGFSRFDLAEPFRQLPPRARFGSRDGVLRQNRERVTRQFVKQDHTVVVTGDCIESSLEHLWPPPTQLFHELRPRWRPQFELVESVELACAITRSAPEAS